MGEFSFCVLLYPLTLTWAPISPPCAVVQGPGSANGLKSLQVTASRATRRRNIHGDAVRQSADEANRPHVQPNSRKVRKVLLTIRFVCGKCYHRPSLAGQWTSGPFCGIERGLYMTGIPQSCRPCQSDALLTIRVLSFGDFLMKGGTQAARSSLGTFSPFCSCNSRRRNTKKHGADGGGWYYLSLSGSC